MFTFIEFFSHFTLIVCKERMFSQTSLLIERFRLLSLPLGNQLEIPTPNKSIARSGDRWANMSLFLMSYFSIDRATVNRLLFTQANKLTSPLSNLLHVSSFFPELELVRHKLPWFAMHPTFPVARFHWNFDRIVCLAAYVGDCWQRRPGNLDVQPVWPATPLESDPLCYRFPWRPVHHLSGNGSSVTSCIGGARLGWSLTSTIMLSRHAPMNLARDDGRRGHGGDNMFPTPTKWTRGTV